MKDTRMKEARAMTKHMMGTREEWLAARLELLQTEKELTRTGTNRRSQRQVLSQVMIVAASP
jgi:predicted dithiol-disulfide oxidoreductase (DUF899 family)